MFHIHWNFDGAALGNFDLLINDKWVIYPVACVREIGSCRDTFQMLAVSPAFWILPLDFKRRNFSLDTAILRAYVMPLCHAPAAPSLFKTIEWVREWLPSRKSTQHQIATQTVINAVNNVSHWLTRVFKNGMARHGHADASTTAQRCLCDASFLTDIDYPFQLTYISLLHCPEVFMITIQDKVQALAPLRHLTRVPARALPTTRAMLLIKYEEKWENSPWRDVGWWWWGWGDGVAAL